MNNKKLGKWKLPMDFNIGKLKKDQLLILLLAGILLLVIAVPTGKKGKEDDGGKVSASYISDASSDSVSESDYVAYLENHLEQTLSQMEGAGDVEVMITLAASSEKIVEKDREDESEDLTESDSTGGTRSTQNMTRKETTVYNNDGNDRQTPYISKEITPKVEGVVVLASGGDRAVVVRNITEAVQALFGIDTHKIRIIKKNQNMGEE